MSCDLRGSLALLIGKTVAPLFKGTNMFLAGSAVNSDLSPVFLRSTRF